MPEQQSFFRSIFSWIPSVSRKKKTFKVILLGLDAAGKTTFLYKVKSPSADVETSIPTIGFNVEELRVGNQEMACWDVGGCDKIRPLWRHYTEGAAGLVFVVDSNDRERFSSAKEELDTFLSDESLRGVPLLLVANKQDLRGAASAEEVLVALGVHRIADRPWRVFPCCMTASDDSDALLVQRGHVPARTILRCCQRVLDGSLGDSEHCGGISSDTYVARQSLYPLQSIASLEDSDVKKEPVAGQEREEEQRPQPHAQRAEDSVEEHDRKKRNLLWQSWHERELDEDDDFVAQLTSYRLQSWDHFTHVRLAWVYVTRLDVERGFSGVEQTIEDFIRNSELTNGKSFHPTMTRFWCHVIAFWLAKQRAEDIAAGRDHRQRDFRSFLRYVHTHKDLDMADLANGGLFRLYYSPARIFSEQARAERVRPDLRELPDLKPFLRALSNCDDEQIAEQSREDLLYIEESDYWSLSP